METTSKRADDSLSDSLLFINARIYTLNGSSTGANRHVVDSLLVRDGKIVEVGKAEDVRAHAGHSGSFDEVDLQGKTVMPGLIDVHNHHAEAGEAELHKMQIHPGNTMEEILQIVRRAASAAEPGQWLAGESYGSQLIAELSSAQALEAFDKASDGHPVLISDDTHHNKWANSAALKAAGITKASIDPAGGVIVRDRDTGEPTGLLFEAAAAPVAVAYAQQRDLDDEHYARNSERGIELLHQYGITAFQDAAASKKLYLGLQKLDREGRLKAWVVTSALITDFFGSDDVVGEELLQTVREYKSPHHRPIYAKIFLDGVPPSKTGFFLDPYRTDEIHGCCHKGAASLNVTELDTWMEKCGQLGLGVKVHCSGDASVRMTLDAAAKIRLRYPNLPVQVAHGQYVHPDDVPRFAKLNVSADISPPLWFPSIITDANNAVRPDFQQNKLQPNRSLLDAGALVGGGSDWPVSPSPNPWPAICGLVTRQDPEGKRADKLWPEQAITLDEAIACYTINAAKVIGVEDITGHLAVGLSADFVVLDRDPYAIEPSELGKVETLKTYFAGELVYQAASNGTA